MAAQRVSEKAAGKADWSAAWLVELFVEFKVLDISLYIYQTLGGKISQLAGV